MSNLHFLNGQWVNSQNLLISGMDISLLRGYGVFDVIRTVRSKPLKLQNHIDRFMESSIKCGLHCTYAFAEIEQYIFQGIAQNNKANNVEQDYDIRLVLTGGVGESTLKTGKGIFYMIFTDAFHPPQEWYANGIAVDIIDYVRPLPDIKSTNYMVPIFHLKNPSLPNVIELLLSNNSTIIEGSTSNVFFVKDNVLITADTGILPGVTRQIVLELAQQQQYEIQYRGLHVSELNDISGAFVTGSSKKIVPIATIGEIKIPSIHDTMTKTLMKEYDKYIASI